MILVNKVITKKWPWRLAYLVVRDLMKKFRPTDTMSKIEMRQQLNQKSIKEDRIQRYSLKKSVQFKKN
jgi:hypothetical protein